MKEWKFGLNAPRALAFQSKQISSIPPLPLPAAKAFAHGLYYMVDSQYSAAQCNARAPGFHVIMMRGGQERD